MRYRFIHSSAASRGLLPLLLSVLLLSAPSRADAAITLGSDLGPADNVLPCGSGGDCTVVQTALPGRRVRSPIDGVVVRWRTKDSSSPGPVYLRVVHPATHGRFTGGGYAAFASGPSHPCPDVCTIPAQLPICTGDYIGIDAPAGASGGVRNSGGAMLPIWSPYLHEGETRRPELMSSFEILLNADVERDADLDGLGDETQDSDPSTPGGTRPPCPPPVVQLALRYHRGHDAAGRPCALNRVVRASISGPDESQIRKVAFHFGHRAAVVDREAPFARTVDRARHVGHSHLHHITAVVTTEKGEAVRRHLALRFCAGDG